MEQNPPKDRAMHGGDKHLVLKLIYKFVRDSSNHIGIFKQVLTNLATGL
jgi:hypothetical protein